MMSENPAKSLVAAFEHNCNAAEMLALETIRQQHMPLLNALRLYTKADLWRIVQKLPGDCSNTDYGILLGIITDYVSCAILNDELFDTFRKNKKSSSLSVLCKLLNTRWSSLFYRIYTEGISEDQFRAFLEVFQESVDRLKGTEYANAFEGGMDISKRYFQDFLDSRYMKLSGSVSKNPAANVVANTPSKHEESMTTLTAGSGTGKPKFSENGAGLIKASTAVAGASASPTLILRPSSCENISHGKDVLSSKQYTVKVGNSLKENDPKTTDLLTSCVTPKRKLSTIEKYLVTPPTSTITSSSKLSPKKKIHIEKTPVVQHEKPNAFAIMMKRSKELSEERKLKRKSLF